MNNLEMNIIDNLSDLKESLGFYNAKSMNEMNQLKQTKDYNIKQYIISELIESRKGRENIYCKKFDDKTSGYIILSNDIKNNVRTEKFTTPEAAARD